MKCLRKLLAATLFIGLTATGALAAPASDESIETLLGITRAESMVDGMYGQVEQMARQGMLQGIEGRPLSDEQQRMLDQVPARLAALMREEFKWAQLKPQFVQIYRETFDQTEVDGLIAFYRSPVGQSFVAKMPTLMQKSMGLSQSRLMAMMPRLRAAMEQALAEVKNKN